MVEIIYKEKKDFLETVISHRIEMVYGAITVTSIQQRGPRYDFRLSAIKDSFAHTYRETIWFARNPIDEQTARQDGQKKLDEARKLLRKKGIKLIEGVIRLQEAFEMI